MLSFACAGVGRGAEGEVPIGLDVAITRILGLPLVGLLVGP